MNGFTHRSVVLIFISVSLACSPLAAAPAVYEVKSYGAKGDGTTLDTAALQSAIDAASTAGGGVVHFGAGTYRTTTLTLKSHVTLDLDKGALLQASLDATDWSTCNQHPVVEAKSVTDTGLKGTGTIDGGGMTYYGPDGHVVAGNGPLMVVSFTDCQNVKVTGITCRNSVKWTQGYERCDNVVVNGAIIRNREYDLSRETDGIDVFDSQHVLVQNCDIQTGDDALCLKLEQDPAQAPPHVAHDITFRNCILATTCNATKIGTGTFGEAYDIHFTGITVNKLSPIHPNDNPAPGGSCIAAISVQSNDGGKIHDFTFKDYTVNDCDTPIFMEVQNRVSSRPPHAFGSVAGIAVSNFNCLHSANASQINVQKGGRLARITLNNLTIHNFGTSPGVASPPYLDGGYPDAMKYGEMPAYGLFARCVDGLALTGKINFIDDGHSGRPATKYEDITLSPVSAETPPKTSF